MEAITGCKAGGVNGYDYCYKAGNTVGPGLPARFVMTPTKSSEVGAHTCTLNVSL